MSPPAINLLLHWVWEYGWIPGIKTIDHIAPDVHHSDLNILMDHYFVGEKGKEMQAVIINAKGFGGNNASGLILSPENIEYAATKIWRGCNRCI